jgi:nicotinamidase-related amidase
MPVAAFASKTLFARTPGLRSRCLSTVAVMALSLCAAASVLTAAPSSLQFDLQRRDPTTGAISVTQEAVDPRRIGVVAIDMWNFHWCKTSAARVGALVPRMNKCLQVARQLGMTVFLCPTDVADNYVGLPQYERVLATPLVPVPQVREVECPPAADGGGCTCGKERCQVNYGWDGMAPDLVIGADDSIPNDPQMLYSICHRRGITHLIFLGVHTQVCLLGKSVGLRNMLKAGFQCVLARDLTDAHGKYDPANGVTPDQFTADVVAHFEKHLSPTINLADTFRRAGLWKNDWIVDPVRVTPWGKRARPHLFESEITVTLSTPWQEGAEIRYTFDGSEPTPRSARAPSRRAGPCACRAKALSPASARCRRSPTSSSPTSSPRAPSATVTRPRSRIIASRPV